MESLDRSFMQIQPTLLIGKRANWLVIFFWEVLTATAMGCIERQIERAVGLALFVPLIISSVDSGSQAVTLVDVTGLVIYFSIAAFVLRGTLL